MSLFEKSQKGQRAYSLPKSGSIFERYSPEEQLLRKDELPLPEVSELDLMRHFSLLAQKNMGIDTHFYPLGSCTMKYNPRVNEQAAALPGFCRTHPLAPDETVQGNLELISDLIDKLCDICGMDAGSLVPNAGAQGEFAGIRMIRQYHEESGEPERNVMLIPDSAHGTNPATAAMAGFKTLSLPTDERGDVCLEELEKVDAKSLAGLMLTNPNTLGLFSPNIEEITRIVREKGGLLYYDGANLNPMLYVAKPAEMGFDVMHLNLHKTFSTPHGGGGPGSGPVLCGEKLAPYLPLPRVIKEGDSYRTELFSKRSIGYLASFHGNFSIYLRAYLYILLHGKFGLRSIAEVSIINANYLKKKLSEIMTVPFSQHCMHEFVVQADQFLSQDVRALDIAKRLLDYGIHAPTIYFPLIVKECLLIEPTETESKATLDRFIEVMKSIVQEAVKDPELLQGAPYKMPIKRLNEVLAAKKPVLSEVKVRRGQSIAR